MKFVIGIDGGASKTKTLLCDLQGNILAAHQSSGCSYRQIGIPAAVSAMTEGVAPCLSTAGAVMADVAFICLGVTFLDEDKNDTRNVIDALRLHFGSTPFSAVNDSLVACVGSLGGQAGINVICGTGSGSCGVDSCRTSARSGGWHHFFGDEGSGYWLGRKTMELFSKQADGRVQKGALYDIICRKFALDYDFAFVEQMLTKVVPDAKSVGRMQNLLLEAALQGDKSAADIYPLAAEELFLMVKAVKNSLNLQAPFTVSYSGGVFETGEIILAPFRQLVGSIGGVLKNPTADPAMGAVLMAIDGANSL